MKRAILSAIVYLMCHIALAQQTDVTTLPAKPLKRNEAGLIFLESSVSERPLLYFQHSSVAVQYKRWKNESFGYRFSFGITNFRLHDFVFSRQILPNDTFMEQSLITEAAIPIASVGVEAQRQLYKSVYFYVAADVRFGYGEGSRDTQTTKQYELVHNNKVYYTGHTEIRGNNSSGITMLRLGVVPQLGVKMQLRRVSFGYEAASHIFSFYKINHRRSNLSNFEIDLNNFTTRIYVNYRF